MKSFTRLFLAVFLALSVGGLVLYYLSFPFAAETSSDLDLVRIRLARYLGSVGGLYGVVAALMALASAVVAGGAAAAATSAGTVRRAAVRAALMGLAVTFLGGLAGVGLHLAADAVRRGSAVDAPVLEAAGGPGLARAVAGVTPRRVLSRRIMGYLGEEERPGAGSDVVDPAVLLALLALLAVTVAATRHGGSLRRLVVDGDDALAGLARVLDEAVAPVAFFLIVTSWLLVSWPASFTWYAVVAGTVLLVGVGAVTLISAAAGAHADVSPGHLLRSMRLAHVTAFGLGSPLPAIPQLMACADECLAVSPLQRGVCIPVAACVARPGTALVLGFAGAFVAAATCGLSPLGVLGLAAAATILAAGGLEVVGGTVLGVVAVSAWGGAEGGGAAVAASAVLTVALVAVRFAAAADVTAAAAVALRCGTGLLPEGLDPDLPDDELLRRARRRRRPDGDEGPRRRPEGDRGRGPRPGRGSPAPAPASAQRPPRPSAPGEVRGGAGEGPGEGRGGRRRRRGRRRGPGEGAMEPSGPSSGPAAGASSGSPSGSPSERPAKVEPPAPEA